MEFTDFQPNELIGKTVFIRSGIDSISKIKRVTKTAFEVEGHSGLFSLVSGHKKGGDGRNFTSAKLITDEEADVIKNKWAAERERKKIISLVQEKVTMLNLETLRKIQELIV